MDRRLLDWARQRGIPEARLVPTLVRIELTELVFCFAADLGGEDTARSLADVLAGIMGQACRVLAAPAREEDPLQRLRGIWREEKAAVDSLLDEDAIRFQAGRIVITFPSAVVQSLFERWGGEARLRQKWPEMPPLCLTLAPPVASVPDAPVPVPRLEIDSRLPRVGRGAPSSGAKPGEEDLEPGAEVTLEGRLFDVQSRLGRDKLYHVTLSLADGSTAYRLRVDQRRGQEEFSAHRFESGQWIRARGTAEVDRYTEETVVRVKEAGPIDPPDATRLEDGSDLGRVELHLHTKMSAMDGLVDVGEAFQLAKTLGHPALAIVDHGVVQAYPEAEQWARKTGVRAIYGIEVYMVDDAQAALNGPELSAPWPDTPLVVVDVETTGLSPWAHEVIEIGAVRIERGVVVGQFQRLVRPSRRVSRTSFEITGIRAAELEAAAAPDDVWPEFFGFCRGAALAAHNARFDVGFLARAFARYGQGNWPFAVLDSLTLARIALPDQKSYALDALTRSLGVPLSQHHRALADAEATGQVILKVMESLGPVGSDEGWLRQPQPVDFSVGRPTPVVVLVRETSGIAALYRLISRSHLEFFHRVPRVPRRLLEEHRGEWWLGSPAHGGEIQEALYRGASAEELRRLAEWYDYWEIQPLEVGHDLLREEHLSDLQTGRQWQRALIDLGQRHAKPVVAVSDAHYLRPDHKILRSILAETAKGELHQAEADLHYRTTAEMLAAFSWLDAGDARAVVIDNPRRLLDAIGDVEPIPKGLFSPSMPDAEKVVSTMPIERAREWYGDPLPTIVAERLDKEIGTIVRNGFAVSYYIAHLLVKKSLQDGYLVGSRGSVGSSLVATLLNITEVNPLPPHYRCPQCRFTEFVTDGSVGSGFDLPDRQCPNCGETLVGDGQDIAFETFLGFEGDKVPDIDLNFSGEYQAEIHRYTEELFGEGHVFRAGTIATVATKTAFGLVKAWAETTGRKLRPVEIDWLAAGLTGVRRTTGQHPGGVMVVPRDQDIYRFCPVQHPADNRNSDVVTTHFEYHAIEGRLVKLDLLGHDDPTVIRLLEELTGIDAKAVPFKDSATLSLFSGVDALGVQAEVLGSPVGSVGVPEFGTSFVRAMLTETHPSSFAELVRISGISHGTEVWTNNAQDIIRKGQATLSEVIATRDDIMLYLIQRGIEPRTAFSISESVRKGRGLSGEYERLMREHGVPEWYIQSCHKITYLFPKAHAAAYVMMGWRIAWFKVHHPLAYYASYFTVRASDFPDEVAMTDVKTVTRTIASIESKGNDASAKEKGMITVLEVVREMMARGFRFLPVDLMESDAVRFLVEGEGLRIPFAALSGLGQAIAENIVRARNEQPFLSIADLRERAHVSKSVIELLRRHGSLQGLGESSQLEFF